MLSGWANANKTPPPPRGAIKLAAVFTREKVNKEKQCGPNSERLRDRLSAPIPVVITDESLSSKKFFFASQHPNAADFCRKKLILSEIFGQNSLSAGKKSFGGLSVSAEKGICLSVAVIHYARRDDGGKWP